MKGLVGLLILVLCNGSGLVLKEEEQGRNLGLGQACGTGTPLFVISSFTISPWPPTPGGISSWYMTGTFRTALRISQVHEAFYTRAQTNYIDVDIDQSYNAGQTTTFTYGVQFEQLPGNYAISWTLQDGSSTFISCWQVNYSIS